MRIKNYIDPACVLILAQNLRPRLAAVRRAKNSAFLIWSERVAERGDEDDVGILWMDKKRADVATIS